MENQPRKNVFRVLELISEIFGWLQIMISPTIIGAIIGAIIYFNYQNIFGRIIGIGLGVLGLLLGVIWATKIFKSKKGTVWFTSRVMSTKDLDDQPTTKND